MSDIPKKTLEQVVKADGRYPPEAFQFLQETAPGEGHVTGQEICRRLKAKAIERWGLLARVVLGKWGVTATIDFGNMVYLLIEHEFWRKSPTDTIGDFRDVFEFEEAFESTSKYEATE